MDQGASRVDDCQKVVIHHLPDGGNSFLLNPNNGDKPLSFFGCGIGWLCFILGFVLPLLWYYATFLYLKNYYVKDPRERAGLAASAIAALIFSVFLLIALLIVLC
ncbi:hypothetical protein ACHQM5_014403 [Ranunculus cassubicifolius]